MPLNGTVTRITTTPAGVTSVTVSFPAIPEPPPPGQDAQEITYAPVSGEQLRSCRQALASDTLKLDADGVPPAPGNVSVHR